MVAPKRRYSRSSWRISRQLKEQGLLGLTMLMVGLWLGSASSKLQVYRPVVSTTPATKDKSTKKATSKQNTKGTKASKLLSKPKLTHQRNKGDIIHIIKTRLLQYQPDSPALVQSRIQIFRALVLPSMANQTSQNFFWIVSVENDLEKEYVDQLKSMLAPYPHFYLTDVMMDRKHDGGQDLYSLENATLLEGDRDLLYYHLAERTTVPVLETRIDSDDVLHLGFVKEIQKQAKKTFKDKSLEWTIWCINRAMHYKWFGPGFPENIQQGAFLESRLDTDVCAIPALTVGFRDGDSTENLFRTRAVFLQKEIASQQPSCGSKTKGPACLHVLDGKVFEYPVLRVDTPATPATEKPGKKRKNETERVLKDGFELGKESFAAERPPLEALDRIIRKIPPYYMHPPRVDRSKDKEVAAGIAQINPSQWLKLPSPETYPGDYGRKNRQPLHIVKTRFMQHQPKLVELAKARVELFKAFCLPSMIHQTTQNFFWLIYTDPQLDGEIVEEMVKLLEPYPHYYLVSSNMAKRGLGGKDIRNDLTPTDFRTGNTKRLFRNLNNTHFLNVLESRLDADDAININWIKEVQWRASQIFKEENGRDWMWWCVNQAVEWNWVGPGDRKPLQQYGALVFPRPYDERNFCHTPGMTLGVRRGTFTRTVKKESHHLLYEALEREENPCGPTYNGTDCIAFIANFTTAALRSRTPTSASMASVNTNGGKAYRQAAEQAVERWIDVSKTFGILPSDVKRVNKYFFKHMKPIVMDNIKGQCTEGHSCRVEAEASLNKMLQLYSMNEGEDG